MFEANEHGVAFTMNMVIKNTGNAAGIADIDFSTPAEIRAALLQYDPETSRRLEAFLEAYKEWFTVTTMIQTHLHDDPALRAEHSIALENRRLRSVELQQRLRVLYDQRAH